MASSEVVTRKSRKTGRKKSINCSPEINNEFCEDAFKCQLKTSFERRTCMDWSKTLLYILRYYVMLLSERISIRGQEFLSTTTEQGHNSPCTNLIKSYYFFYSN